MMKYAVHALFVGVIVASLLAAALMDWPYMGITGWGVAIAALIGWTVVVSIQRRNI